jgi:Ulp1 family protease
LNLFEPLSEDESKVVDDFLQSNSVGEPLDLLLDLEGYQINRETMSRLQPGEWLNDEVSYLVYDYLSLLVF